MFKYLKSLRNSKKYSAAQEDILQQLQGFIDIGKKNMWLDNDVFHVYFRNTFRLKNNVHVPAIDLANIEVIPSGRGVFSRLLPKLLSICQENHMEMLYVESILTRRFRSYLIRMGGIPDGVDPNSVMFMIERTKRMTSAYDLAQKLNGLELGVITQAMIREAKDSELVIVTGASDDLMQFEGAISEEFGCYGGGIIYFDRQGELPNPNEPFTYTGTLAEHQRNAARFMAMNSIEVIWDKDGYAWQYKTEIPHTEFDLMEDGKPYCRGIVFSVNDLPQWPDG